MAKRSNKRPTPLEKHNASCMWAFISFFDFRRGSLTPKLLSDKKPGSSRQGDNSSSDNELDRLSCFEDHHEHANNATVTKEEGVELCSASAKTLIGKKKFREHSERNTICDAQCLLSDLGHSTYSGKILQQRSKKHKVTSTADGPAKLDNQQSDKITPTNWSSNYFDLVALLIKLCTCKQPSREILVKCDNNVDLCVAMKDIVRKLNGQPGDFDSHLNPKEYVIYKALVDIFKAIANQAFVDNKHIVKSVHSKGFVDALAILDSNKDVILKLLKDSNSQFYKQIQYLQEIEVGKLTMLASENHSKKVQIVQETDVSSRKGEQVGNRELFHKQHRHSLFWRKDKSKEKKILKHTEKPESLSRIVVLKPTPIRSQEDHIRLIPSFSPGSHRKGHEEETNQIVSYFSLGEIKRRLKHIIGGSKKERQMISMDRILDKIPLGYKVSLEKDQLFNSKDAEIILESKSSHDAENPGVVVPVPMEKGSMVNQGECELNIKNDICVMKASLVCEEAKTHRSKMLDSVNKTTSFPTARVSISLGKLLSLPDFDVLSPRIRDRDEKVLALQSQRNVSFPLPQFNGEDVTNSLSPLKENLGGSSCSAGYQNDALILDLKSELIDDHMQEELCCISDMDHGGNCMYSCCVLKLLPTSASMPTLKKYFSGSVQNVEIVDIASKPSKLVHEQSDVSEPTCNASDAACERCNEDLGPLEVEALTVRQSELSTSSFHKGTREFPESIIRKPGRSAPVPILERFISDDFSSYKLRAVHTFLQTTDDAKTTFRTSFGDSKAGIKYVEAVLDASGLRTIDFTERWHLADKLLDPSLFDIVGGSCSPQTDDPKLLFDCISEALEEIQEKYFKCTPWVSMLTYNYQKAPVGRSLIREVVKRIERHVLINLPNVVDHIVLSGLEDGRWMDLQFETEEIAIEIWDTALDDLVDETIFDLWLELADGW